MSKLQNAIIFNTMRILKKLNPGDTYYEAYQGHLRKNGDQLYDLYMLLWEIGADRAPRNILEIGTRTGISLCQLLSAYIDHSIIDRIVCVDPFSDGYLSANLVRANLRYLNLPTGKLEFLQEKSETALPKLLKEEAKFDFILVDGCHEKNVAREDLEFAHKLCAIGGIIAFDDISTEKGECGLLDVWEDFEKIHSEQYLFGRNLSGKGVAWATKK